MTTPTTADFVGLADTIYRRTDLTNGSRLQINGTKYQVVDVINHSGSDGFYGAVLLDQSTNALFVVNRGTEPTNWRDWATDVIMATTDQNAQWQDADALATFASQYATANGSLVYTVGHSLGGTLAQMQAAIHGWTGVTFNAYGSSEVLGKLGYTVDPDQPNITNYRTLFDLVSNSSTQIGNVVTLETAQDRTFLASGELADPLDLVKTIASDHGISNFYNARNSDPAGSGHAGVPTYVAASMFSFPAPTDLTTYMAQRVVLGFGKSLAATREAAIEVHNATNPKTIAADVLDWITGSYKPTETVTIAADSYMLGNALDPATAFNIYRASLDAGSSVVLAGIDPAEVQNDTLWTPGQTTGLTKEYLVARNAMVQASLRMAGEGLLAGGTITTHDSATHVYTDLKESGDPLYTLVGQGPDTYSITFGTDGDDVLQPTPGTTSEVFGGAGDDMLVDGAGSSTLEGGAGADHYWIDGTEAGTDHILDTDGQGDISWGTPGGSGTVLIGGEAVPGGSMWKSADGSITYTERAQADGTTELEIRGDDKTVFVEDFTNGELGITLNDGTPPTLGAGNLASFTHTAYTDHDEYQDRSGAAGGDSMIGVDTTGKNYNLLEGDGNASYIYAGNGNNQAFADDWRNSPTAWVFTQPLSVTIQGGTGNQLLVGLGIGNGEGKETIVGGDVGADTTAITTIDGGGANVDALLDGGSQNSFILGGLGTDTIVAGSGAPATGKPGPTTVALAGLSFWAYYQQSAQGGGKAVVTGEPQWGVPAAADPADFQVDIALDLLDVPGSVDPSGQLGTHYGAPFGLLGSVWDTGTDTSPWKDSKGNPVVLPGSLMIGGSGNEQNPGVCRPLHRCGIQRRRYRRRWRGECEQTIVGIFLHPLRVPAYRLHWRRQYSGACVKACSTCVNNP